MKKTIILTCVMAILLLSGCSKYDHMTFNTATVNSIELVENPDGVIITAITKDIRFENDYVTVHLFTTNMNKFAIGDVIGYDVVDIVGKIASD